MGLTFGTQTDNLTGYELMRMLIPADAMTSFLFDCFLFHTTVDQSTPKLSSEDLRMRLKNVLVTFNVDECKNLVHRWFAEEHSPIDILESL